MSAAIVALREPSDEPVLALPYGQPAEADLIRPAPLRPLVLPSTREAFSTRLAWIAVAFCVASLYLYALMSFAAPAHPGVDQNGYFVGGRLYAETFSSGLKPESDFAFIGRMWILEPISGINYPKYPLGLPILFAGCLWLFGERGYELAHYISPITSALAALGVFAIVRRFSGGFAGVLGLLLLACGQTMFTLSINPNSHAACTCAVVWGMFFLIRWLESGSLWRGILAGFLFGFAYMIRYTEGLLLLPLAVALLYKTRWTLPSILRTTITLLTGVIVAGVVLGLAWKWGGSYVTRWPMLTPFAEEGGRPLWIAVIALLAAAVVSLFVEGRALWRLLAVAAAWGIPVAYLTLFNMTHMLAFTSYAGTNESTGFTMRDFWANWEKMIRVLHDQGLFFIAPIGVLGLFVMFRRLPLVATILALWFVPSVLLYTAYYWAPDNMGVSYSRFILTQLPALVIAAAWLLGEVTRRMGRGDFLGRTTTRLAVGFVVFVACSLGVARTLVGSEWGQRMQPRANIEFQSRQNNNLAGLGDEVRRAVRPRTKDAAGKLLPPISDKNIILFSEGERMHHLQWIGSWQLFAVEAFNAERMQRGLWRQAQEEDEPDPIDPSRVKFLQELYKGKDQRALQGIQNDLIATAIANGKRVYTVLSDGSTRQFERQIDRKKFEVNRVGSFTDMPGPRLEEDFLLPSEKPKAPVNRFGRGNAFNNANFFPGASRETVRISEVVLKLPTTMPTTFPATSPTTAPAKS